MAITRDCMYCLEDERLTDIMIHICDLKMSKVYLFKDQTYYGRCVVACKRHVDELFELSAQERADFSDDVAAVAKAIYDTVSPKKINYGIYGDKVSHLHVHLAPKQVDGPDFGGTFVMAYNPPKHLDEAEYLEIIEKIKEKLV